MQWRDEELLVWSQQSGSFFQLNPTASLIWLLCNGSLTVGGIISRMQEFDPVQSDQIDRDIRDTLLFFLEKGLVQAGDLDRPRRKIIYVGFCNFWDGFDVRDNYFLWMLSHKFDVMILDPWDTDLNIIFYSEFSASTFDRHQVHRAEAIKVQVSLNGRPDFTRCDYAFSSREIQDAAADRYFHLPYWALYLDWHNFAASEPVFHGHWDFEQYKPETAIHKFYHAFFQIEVVQPAALRVLEHPSLRNGPTRKLTIGLATYDDFDGAYFTVQAIRLFHPEVTRDTEIMILDNQPAGACGEALRHLVSHVDGLLYIPYPDWRSTAVRDIVFREARTPYVLCLDSHVFLSPGSIQRLIQYFEDHPDSSDLLQGVLLSDGLEPIGTHFKPEWRAGMYGTWGNDERGRSVDDGPFEIPMQGLGVFACRKEAWLGFNPRFRGFGGEEGYIHEKYRQAGHKTVCLPFLRWVHRFGRPAGTTYTVDWADRVINYHIGFHELGLETSQLDEHFRIHLGDAQFDEIKARVKMELANPFFLFDAIYCINLDSATKRWQAINERFNKLGIGRRVCRFSAIETPRSHHIGCALSHRRIIEKAWKRNLEQVLIFEDDAIFLEDTLDHLRRTIPELKRQDWQLFYLGGHRWGREYKKPTDCDYLYYVHESLTSAHAVACHHSVYERILNDLPDSAEEMEKWIDVHKGIDQYFTGLDKRFLSSPAVASQPVLLPVEETRLQDKYTL